MGLTRTLTLSELQAALQQAPVRVRVAYFAAGDVRGTWAKPSAWAARDALHELTALQRAASADGMNWTRKNAVQVIQWKKLERVLAPHQPEALKQLQQSTSLRYGVLNVVREHQAWLDARAVAQSKRGFICGLQVVGTPTQLLAFAQAVRATGFTFDQGELFNSMRPADPTDLKERLQRLPGSTSAPELLRLGQRAFADFWRE